MYDTEYFSCEVFFVFSILEAYWIAKKNIKNSKQNETKFNEFLMGNGLFV